LLYNSESQLAHFTSIKYRNLFSVTQICSNHYQIHICGWIFDAMYLFILMPERFLHDWLGDEITEHFFLFES